MRSASALVFLVCALSIPGCKKHAAGAGDAGSDDAGADDGGVDAGVDAADAESAAPEAGADEDAAVVAADASLPPLDTVTTGSSFAGAYACWGGTLTLVQTGSQVTGNAYTHAGNLTQTTEVLCTIQGNRCVGQTTYFSQKGEHAPKTAGKGKLVLTAQTGGLRYVTTHGGTQEGFCPRR